MRKLFLIASAIAILAIIACSSDEQTNPNPYYPHGNNSSWTYEVTYDWKSFVEYHQYNLNGITQHADGTPLQVLERWIPYEGLWVMTQKFVLADSQKVDFFYTLDDTNPYHVLKFPLEVGNTWPAYDEDEENWMVTVLGYEDVTVPAGTFSNCVKISLYSEQDPDWFEYHYLDENVGEVKVYAGYPGVGETTSALHSYNIVQ